MQPPIERKWIYQPWQPEPFRQPPVQDRFRDVRRQQRQPQQGVEVSPLDLPSRGHLADRGVAPLAQQLLVPEGSGQRRLSTWDKASCLSCRIGVTTYPAPAAADKLAGKITFAQDRASAGRAIRFGWERRDRCRQP